MPEYKYSYIRKVNNVNFYKLGASDGLKRSKNIFPDYIAKDIFISSILNEDALKAIFGKEEFFILEEKEANKKLKLIEKYNEIDKYISKHDYSNSFKEIKNGNKKIAMYRNIAIEQKDGRWKCPYCGKICGKHHITTHMKVHPEFKKIFKPTYKTNGSYI